jgi:hypothetical protein
VSQEYDASKDRLVYGPDDAFKDEHTRLTVSFYVYGDTGKPKIQISRERNQKGEWTFVKLGRMNYVEFSAVARAAKEGFAAIERGEVKSGGDRPEGW